jgi:Branched-chain amino acid ABC-type transport system, permease components
MNWDVFVQVFVNGLLTGGLYMVAAVGLTLIFGVLHVIYFAHGETIMMGAYVTYFLFTLAGVDPLVSLFFSVGLMSLAGFAIQKVFIKPILNAPHLNQILLTYGIAIILQNVVLVALGGDYVSMTTRYSGLSFEWGSLRVGLVRLLEFFFALALTAGLTWWLKRTDTGRAVRAVTQNIESAKLMGIKVDRVFLITFVIGSALGGVAGVMVSIIMYVYPMIGFSFVLKSFAIVVLGGFGSIPGAVVGSMILGVTESLVSQYVSGGSGWSEGVSFVVIILVLLIRPGGLFYAQEQR